MESPPWYLGLAPDSTDFTVFSIIRLDKYGYQGDATCVVNIEYRTASTRAALSSQSYQIYNGTSFTRLVVQQPLKM